LALAMARAISAGGVLWKKDSADTLSGLGHRWKRAESMFFLPRRKRAFR
jgi:hypothetical protein